MTPGVGEERRIGRGGEEEGGVNEVRGGVRGSVNRGDEN